MSRWPVLALVATVGVLGGCGSPQAGLAETRRSSAVRRWPMRAFTTCIANGADACGLHGERSVLRGHVPPCLSTVRNAAVVSVAPRSATDDSLVEPWVEHFYSGWPCPRAPAGRKRLGWPGPPRRPRARPAATCLELAGLVRSRSGRHGARHGIGNVRAPRRERRASRARAAARARRAPEPATRRARRAPRPPRRRPPPPASVRPARPLARSRRRCPAPRPRWAATRPGEARAPARLARGRPSRGRSRSRARTGGRRAASRALRPWARTACPGRRAGRRPRRPPSSPPRAVRRRRPATGRPRAISTSASQAHGAAVSRATGASAGKIVAAKARPMTVRPAAGSARSPNAGTIVTAGIARAACEAERRQVHAGPRERMRRRPR